MLPSIKNQFLIFEITLQIYQIILIDGIFPGSYLDNSECMWNTFFHKIMVAEKNYFSSNA